MATILCEARRDPPMTPDVIDCYAHQARATRTQRAYMAD